MATANEAATFTVLLQQHLKWWGIETANQFFDINSPTILDVSRTARDPAPLNNFFNLLQRSCGGGGMRINRTLNRYFIDRVTRRMRGFCSTFSRITLSRVPTITSCEPGTTTGINGNLVDRG
jgi:hypothetical protein